MKPKLTEIQERAYQILLRDGPMRGSDLGWHLWGDTTAAPRRGEGSHAHNKFCRPAGKILKQLERLELVIWRPYGNCAMWRARK